MKAIIAGAHPVSLDCHVAQLGELERPVRLAALVIERQQFAGHLQIAGREAAARQQAREVIPGDDDPGAAWGAEKVSGTNGTSGCVEKV